MTMKLLSRYPGCEIVNSISRNVIASVRAQGKIQNAGRGQRNDRDTTDDRKADPRLLRFGLWIFTLVLWGVWHRKSKPVNQFRVTTFNQPPLVGFCFCVLSNGARQFVQRMLVEFSSRAAVVGAANDCRCSLLLRSAG